MSAAVDVVIVSYRCRDLLLSCCAAATGAGDVRLTVVDNASGDGSVEAVRDAFPAARVLESATNTGFARAVNRGVAGGDAPAVLLLNPDACVSRPALDALRAALDAHRDVAAVGPRVRDPEGRLELTVDRTMSPGGDLRIRLLEAMYAGGRGPAAPFLERTHARPRDARSLSAACLLVRRAAFEAVGGMDERFFLYAEDVDLCLRLRAGGWRLRYEPRAEVVHMRGASGRGAPEAVERAWRASQLALYQKHRSPASVALLRLWVRARYRATALLGTGDRRRRAQRMLRWLGESGG